MSVEISAKPRPVIPYEHPDAAMYCLLFKQHIIRQWYKNAHMAFTTRVYKNCFRTLRFRCNISVIIWFVM